MNEAAGASSGPEAEQGDVAAETLGDGEGAGVGRERVTGEGAAVAVAGDGEGGTDKAGGP